jgi:hypothetical protein
MVSRKWELLESTLAEAGRPGIQRASFQLLNEILGGIAEGCGPLPGFTQAGEVAERAALLISHLRGSLQNVHDHHGSAFQLARTKGENDRHSI